MDEYELEYDGFYFKLAIPDYWVNIYRGQKREPLYPDYRLMLDLVKKVDKSRYIMDVGANHGLFGVPASKLGYKVFGFEPVEQNIVSLQKAKELNNLKDFDMFHLALSNKNEQVQMFIPECPDNSSFSQEAAISNMRGKEFRSETVEAMKFDDWIVKNTDYFDVGLIKMDTQGAEFNILEGMGNYLRLMKDIYLIVEYEPHTLTMGHSYEELDNLIISYGFKYVSHLSPNDKIFYK